jgi:hypothetical protein
MPSRMQATLRARCGCGTCPAQPAWQRCPWAARPSTAPCASWAGYRWRRPPSRVGRRWMRCWWAAAAGETSCSGACAFHLGSSAAHAAAPALPHLRQKGRVRALEQRRSLAAELLKQPASWRRACRPPTARWTTSRPCALIPHAAKCGPVTARATWRHGTWPGCAASRPAPGTTARRRLEGRRQMATVLRLSSEGPLERIAGQRRSHARVRNQSALAWQGRVLGGRAPRQGSPAGPCRAAWRTGAPPSRRWSAWRCCRRLLAAGRRCCWWGRRMPPLASGRIRQGAAALNAGPCDH